MAEPRPVAVLAALREEMAPLLRRLADPRKAGAAARAYTAGTISGRPVALVRTGIGVQAARTAAEWVFRELSPAATLSMGFAGGLRDDLRPGDLVLASEVFEPPPPEGEGPRQWEADPRLLECIRKGGDGKWTEGRIATVRRALQTAEEKREFGKRHGSIAVDMESSGIARAANALGTPVVYLRAIVDDAAFDLPLDFTKVLTPDGRLNPLGAIGAILGRPKALLALRELRRRARIGAESLAAQVAALVRLLPPG